MFCVDAIHIIKLFIRMVQYGSRFNSVLLKTNRFPINFVDDVC